MGSKAAMLIERIIREGEDPMAGKLEDLAQETNGEVGKVEDDDDGTTTMTTKHEADDDAEKFAKKAEDLLKKEGYDVEADVDGKKVTVEYKKGKK